MKNAPNYKDQDFAACCGNCKYAGYQNNIFNSILCYRGDVPDKVNDSRTYTEDELDEWWCSHLVHYEGICDCFVVGIPQHVTWMDDFKEVI